MFLIYRDDYTINVHYRYSIWASICQGIVKFVFYWFPFAPCWILMSNDLLTPFEVISTYACMTTVALNLLRVTCCDTLLTLYAVYLCCLLCLYCMNLVNSCICIICLVCLIICYLYQFFGNYMFLKSLIVKCSLVS